MIFDLIAGLNVSEQNFALNQLAPTPFRAFDFVNMQIVGELLRAAFNPKAELCCGENYCRNFRFTNSSGSSIRNWYQPFGNFMYFDHIEQMPSFHARGIGGAVGVDSCVGSGFNLGGTFAYNYEKIHWNHRGQGSTDSYLGGLYGSWLGSSLLVDFAFFGGGNHYDEIKRKIEFETIDRTAKHNAWAGAFNSYLGLTYNKANHDRMLLQPFVTVAYYLNHYGSFTERGAESLNLHVKSRTSQFFETQLGFRWNQLVNDWILFYIALAWDMKAALGNKKIYARFFNTPHFNVITTDNIINSAVPEVGLSMRVADRISWVIDYRGEFGGDHSTHELDTRLQFQF